MEQENKQLNRKDEDGSSSEDLELKDLGHYYGTEQYHNVMGANVTDGIMYIMENGYAWLVTDFLSLIAVNHKNLRNQEFLSVRLLKRIDDKAKMEVGDGNGGVLYKQFYEFTDAKRELHLYFVDNVLMLSGEY